MSAPTTSTETRRFTLLDRIGSGGFGDVYKATMNSGSGVTRTVAIKVLHKDLAANSQGLQRLRDEGKMLGLLQHPAIVRVLDLVVLDGRAALVTEFVEGSDLGVCFRRGGLGPRALIQVAGQVASALDGAWNVRSEDGEQLKLVHRDVKPENIRVGRHGDVKLLDFGIAKAGGFKREARTEAGDVVGSFRYMAPERLARSHEDTAEGDVYSLGAVLYEGLAGRRLFSGTDLRAQVGLAGDGPMHNAFMRRRVDLIDPGPVLENLLMATLAHDPRLRPSAAKVAALLDDLSDAQAGPTLRKWARTWDWPAEDKAPGPLTGKVIREVTQPVPVGRVERDNITLMVFDEPTQPLRPPSAGQSLPPDSQVPVAPPPMYDPTEVRGSPGERDDPGGGWWLWLAAVVLGGGVIVAASGMGVLGGVAWYVGSGATGAAPPPRAGLVVGEPQPDGPEPAAAPSPVEPEPEPEPEGTEPGEGEEAVEEVAPAPARRPAAAPPPKPAPEAPGLLQVDGRVPVELRRGDEVVKTGEVPAGAWLIYADFGEGMVRANPMPVDVRPGEVLAVKCSTLKLSCAVTSP